MMQAPDVHCDHGAFRDEDGGSPVRPAARGEDRVAQGDAVDAPCWPLQAEGLVQDVPEGGEGFEFLEGQIGVRDREGYVAELGPPRGIAR